MNILEKLKITKPKVVPEFKPYKKKIGLDLIDAEFFYGTAQAETWYDPLKPYAKLEYDWVLENINLKGKKIIDGGSHHGQYAVVLGKGAENDCQLIAIDPFPMNCLLTEINKRFNDLDFEIIQAAISTQKGEASFTDRSNGQLSEEGELKVKTITLSDTMPDVEVIKLDVEGAEFSIIPAEIDKLKNCNTWIVEVHPAENRNPETLINLFQEKGFKVSWVNRDLNTVEEYKNGTQWDIHSTIFATK